MYGRVAVAGLHQMVIEARRKEQHVLAAGRVDDRARVGRDARAARKDAQIRRLKMREERVVALDRHHGFERLDAVAVVERADVELVPAVAPARPVGIVRCRA